MRKIQTLTPCPRLYGDGYGRTAAAGSAGAAAAAAAAPAAAPAGAAGSKVCRLAGEVPRIWGDIGFRRGSVAGAVRRRKAAVVAFLCLSEPSSERI